MNFLLADTFTDSLSRLTGEEQKAVKTTAFDLQVNPANPGMKLHKLDKAKDKNFWSVRVSADIRIIVHRTDQSLLLCYVDHHDKAYRWAERRKLETHPKTGAAQIVEIRETIKEVTVPVYVQTETPAPRKPSIFQHLPDEELLGYGVPAEWLEEVKQADEDSLLKLADHLPAEAGEALLELAVGGKPVTPAPAVAPADPFEHPDARRRFRIVANSGELQQALEYPWEKWTIFLHPEQRQYVERDYQGPARISGSAGTGKTIVAVHRAVHLARTHPDSRILLTTFSDALANALHTKLKRLVAGKPELAERIDVHSLNSIGLRLHKSLCGRVNLIDGESLDNLLREASQALGNEKFSLHFLRDEWVEVVDAWQLDSWEAYRDVTRLGRKTRLPESQRATLWTIFENVRAGLRERNLKTLAEIFTELAGVLSEKSAPPYDFAIVDEAQDISVAQLRFLAALGGERPNALFFAGDLGQRIFQPLFSWKSLGVDIRGRSQTLRVNYRTSHQIRAHADRLLGTEVSDVDGNSESRKGTVSAFNGPPPEIKVLPTEAEEIATVADWLSRRTDEGILPHEFGVFVRSSDQLDRAKAAVEKSGLQGKTLDEQLSLKANHVSISTMHLAKGLEFRAVAVMACDDEVIPSQTRIEAIGDEADLEEVYTTERHLLYVACTRARDYLLITGITPGSEFLDDLQPPTEAEN